MKLFEKVAIRGLTMKNRFVSTAAFGPDDIERFTRFAEGDVGLIITGGTNLDEIPHFEKVVESVHAHDGKIAIQLVCSGGRFGQDPDAIAVSVLEKNSLFFNPLVKYSPHHAATEEEIEKIIASYAESAKAAVAIHADAVQIHSAHQSFLSQFLSPITNKRTDRWGGSIENRTRIHRAIYESIRAKVGKDLPILIKVGVEDAFKEGLRFQEGKEIALRIANYGYDALEISQGLQDFRKIMQFDWEGTPMRNGKKEGYFSKWCEEIKKEVSLPVIMQGGLRSYEFLEMAVEKHQADLVGLCRPLICEPNLIKRWKNGDLKKANCVSCNRCILEFYMNGQPLKCFAEIYTGSDSKI